MSTFPPGKYQLKSLHEEIDLFDRKLAHLLKYEDFPTDAARKAAAGKLSAKRDLLVRKAQRMADDGVEFNESELPKSLRAEKPGLADPVLTISPQSNKNSQTGSGNKPEPDSLYPNL